nr:MAG TPA: hypothetical protein [Caudoviricetes sp.]
MAKKLFQQGNKIGNRFSSENQPENRRKPKIFSVLKKNYGIDLGANGDFTQGQIQDLLQALLCVDVRQTTALNVKLNNDLQDIVKTLKNGGEVEKLKKDEVISQVFIVLSQAISREAAKGESGTIRWIIEYLFGRATQPIEGSIDAQVTNNSMDLSALTTEELLQYNTLLEKIKAGNNG